MRLTLTLLAFLVVGFAWPASAAAARVSFSPWDTAIVAAHLHWGGDPPCGAPSFSVRDNLPDGHPMAADIEHCAVVVSRASPAMSPIELCSEIVHEFGHLWGYGHTDIVGDIMNGDVLVEDWACRRLMRQAIYAWRCRARSPGPRHQTECEPVWEWRLR